MKTSGLSLGEQRGGRAPGRRADEVIAAGEPSLHRKEGYLFQVSLNADKKSVEPAELSDRTSMLRPSRKPPPRRRVAATTRFHRP